MTPPRPIHRLAIVNRGESAMRCVRAVKALRAEEGSSLLAIALYTDVDRDAPFVRHADVAVRLAAPHGEVAAYLDHDGVLEALRRAGADAVWPGWGFVAESPEFADRVVAEGLCFLGPPGAAMRALGDKIAAKQLAERVGIPVAPWSGGAVAGAVEACRLADRVGFPLVVKAAAGGGGRGMRVVAEPAALAAAFAAAAAEATAAFGDGRLFLERHVAGGRHIEIQLAADAHGHVLALGARDCSVQRRHQKLVEEAPPPGVDTRLLDELSAAAVRLAREVGYVGLGTVEFLVAGERACFLEMNPRLQVEHGITEAVTGLDLVQLQIRIARGESLEGLAVRQQGAAIEARVCAEDPGAGFAPGPGPVTRFDPALGPGVRVDTGIAAGSVVPAAFDSLIAKVIASGTTREQARSRLVCALRDLDLVVQGGASNTGWLVDVLDSDDFRRGGVDTGWVDRGNPGSTSASADDARDALVAAAILAYQRRRSHARANFFADASNATPARAPASVGQQIDLTLDGVAYRLEVWALGSWRYRVRLGDASVTAMLREGEQQLGRLELADRTRRLAWDASDAGLRLEVDGRSHRFGWETTGQVQASTPAMVVAIAVAAGDRVEAGQVLGVLEAMKTEIGFTAPVAGVVTEIRVARGQRVAAGDVLIVVDPGDGGDAGSGAARVTLVPEPDPLAPLLADPPGAAAALVALDEAAQQAALVALHHEIDALFLGYDGDPERAAALATVVESVRPEDLPDGSRHELATLARSITRFADVEQLFVTAPVGARGRSVAPSNAARLRAYVRRMRAAGAGMDAEFLALVQAALNHFGIASLAYGAHIERAVLRLIASQHAPEARRHLAAAVVRCLGALDRAGVLAVRDEPVLVRTLRRIAAMRTLVGDSLADAAIEAQAVMVEQPRRDDGAARAASGTAPSPEVAERIGLARLENFVLEPVPAGDDLYCFQARSRTVPDDERLFVFAEVHGPDWSSPEDTPRQVAALEQAFHRATTALRALRSVRDPRRRLHWNRITVVVNPTVARFDQAAVEALARRLAPATRHLGLEKVVIRLRLAPEGTAAELAVSDVTGRHLEVTLRAPSERPLAPATPYEQRVVEARRRRLVYPYEIVRMRLARDGHSPAGTFEEYDLDPTSERPVAVSVAERPPGENQAGVVFGILTTPTEKVPEGLRRVLILSDPTRDMGALGPAECDRVVAAIDLAESLGLPVEWVPISSGARIAMDSGTENLDATARVVRRIVSFTRGGGVIHVIVYGVNVGAQSYWNALSTMLSHTRGALVMTPGAAMVLTGTAALAASGSVTAEDEVALGGFERTMGPNGEAQYYARDLATACRVLDEHYAFTWVAPGEPGPRPYRTDDPVGRDVSAFRYPEFYGHGFATVGEIFDDATNPGRKRPFAIRPVMEALVDQDGGHLERWASWAGAEMAVVWDAHLGGVPICLIGIESQPVPRDGYRPPDGPAAWTGGTLFPRSSKKVARAIRAATGNRPVVVLANLSGFDGSPESLRKIQLEHGAEIARAVVEFDRPLLFVVVSRYHGGAYVVFSRSLNPQLRAFALTGSYASVIGGAPAATAVFVREVRARAAAAPEVRRLRAALGPGASAAEREAFARAMEEATRAARAEVAAEFDAIHTVERACRVGSLDGVIEPREMRAALIGVLRGAAGGGGR